MTKIAYQVIDPMTRKETKIEVAKLAEHVYIEISKDEKQINISMTRMEFSVFVQTLLNI